MTKRDVTRLLVIVADLQATCDHPKDEILLAEAKTILTDMDARTGKRDPSKRKKA